MRLPFGLSAYSRGDGRLAPVRLVNFYVEQSPTSPGGVVAIPRPGLAEHMDLSVRGLYREDGVFDGDLFTVSGGDLRRGEDIIGTVAGTDRPEWAYTVDGLFLLSGGIVYQCDGTAAVATAFPDGALVASIAQLNSILVAVRADTGTMYFRLPGDTVWGALDFFSAERKPDPVKAVRTLGDNLYAFGTASIEIFVPTNDSAVPFQRLDGASINRGLKSRDSICALDNTMLFVGEDNIAYRLATPPTRISDHGIEERLRQSESVEAFTYSWDGHTFLVLGLDGETLAYDIASGWSQMTYDGGKFPALGLYDGESVYVGGDKVWTMADRGDDDGAEIERIFTAVMAAEKPMLLDCLEVQCSPGTTAPNVEPAIVQMRWSDDQGRTWTDWKDGSTGMSGEYRKRVRYRRLGMADSPGRVMEFRQTDPAIIRYSGCVANPANGGRAR